MAYTHTEDIEDRDVQIHVNISSYVYNIVCIVYAYNIYSKIKLKSKINSGLKSN